MKLIDLYRLIIKKGMSKDPRTASELSNELGRVRREFGKTRGPDRQAFDRDALWNPYADTRILYGDPATEVRTIMVGIDMEAPEIIAADRLNEKGEEIDLVMAHHPEGAAWAKFYDVMRIQTAMFIRLGVSAEVAGEMLKDRMGEVERAVAPANHLRSVDIARLLDIPYMCCHTPADNHVAAYLQRLFDTRKPARLSDVLGILKNIP